MEMKDALILSLATKLHICSRLLTCAAMRLGWDEDHVRQLVAELRDSIFTEVDMTERAGSINADDPGRYTGAIHFNTAVGGP